MGKVILITGTSRGIGEDLSYYFLKNDNFVIGCSRGETSIENDKYRHHTLDICNEIDVVNMVKNIKKEFGKIDILINCAGIASMNHILTTSVESVKKLFDTNFLGTFLFTREVSKVMIKQKNGVIVNFSTIAKALNLEGEAIYSASKAAVENFTITSSKELSPFNIRVNCIAPTPIKTNLIKAVPKDKIEKLLQMQTIKRFGNFKDIQNVVSFFCSDESSFITGQTLYLGGIN